MFFPEQMNPDDRFHDCTVRMGQVQIRLSANERKEPDRTGILAGTPAKPFNRGKNNEERRSETMILWNIFFTQTQECTNNQVPEQMNRYTVHTNEKTDEQRGRRYLSTRRKLRRKRKEPLWIRICRYMRWLPGGWIPPVSGSPAWRTVRSAGTPNPVM